jgi:hypothetical protein
MGDEGAGQAFLGLLGELLVLVSGDGCLVYARCTGNVEGPQPSAIGFAATLRGEAVRGLQQPERRPRAQNRRRARTIDTPPPPSRPRSGVRRCLPPTTAYQATLTGVRRRRGQHDWAAGLSPSDRVAAATAADEREAAAQPEFTTVYTGRELRSWAAAIEHGGRRSPGSRLGRARSRQPHSSPRRCRWRNERAGRSKRLRR